VVWPLVRVGEVADKLLCKVEPAGDATH
jgi:hypothetical protein